jgi:high-affinity K+ transport system ATPase subunit B
MFIFDSVQSIWNEFQILIEYLLSINVINVINNFNIEKIPYASTIISFISISCFCVSILYLTDGVHTHWQNTFQKTNKYNTKKYNNVMFLVLYESIKYLLQIPNLITLFVGIIQAIYVSKYINVGVSIACWIFALSNELTKHNNSKISDEKINSNIVSICDDKNNDKETENNNKKVRSDKLVLGNNLSFSYTDKTPAFIKVQEITLNQDSDVSDNEKKDYQVGFYDDKESTGEEISKPFTLGDIIPPHRIITRPYINIIGKIVRYVEPITHNKLKHHITMPNFLNKVRFVIDTYAIVLLLFISLCISASATVDKQTLGNVFKHFFACLIAGNILIPSMRMTLLYNIYTLVLSASFSTIKINSYDAFTKLSNIKSIIFDKTGTITEEHLSVHQHYLFDKHTIFDKLKVLGWSIDEITFAVTIANSESNLHEKDNKIYGTSPEENKILEYWAKTKNVKLLFNPVSSSNNIRFQFPECPERYIIVKNRYPYDFDNGKIAVISFVNENEGDNQEINMVIRQHGTTRFLDSTINTKVSTDDMLSLIDDNSISSHDWSGEVIKNDKRRSMAIAVAVGDNMWEILSVYSFDNPLRTKVNTVMDFFRNKHLPCSILTGDGRETAEDIAKNAGFPENIHNVKNEKDIIEFLQLAKNHKISVSIEAKILHNMLNNTESLSEQFLNHPHIFKIIYKASKNIKEHVVLSTEQCMYVGDAKNDELAIQKANIGVCLSHGAETCRLYASICIKEPVDLIDLMSQNGYKDMLLTGGQKIFKDVCFLGGLICGCLVVGIHLNHFEFLNQSSLYKDVWNPVPMLMISSVLYTSSVIGYSSSDCNEKNINNSIWLVIYSILNNLCGFGIGISISWFIKNYLVFLNFDKIILHIITLIILGKHSLHCLYSDRVFGNQIISNSNQMIGFIMNILDSVPFRILLYVLFCFIF